VLLSTIDPKWLSQQLWEDYSSLLSQRRKPKLSVRDMICVRSQGRTSQARTWAPVQPPTASNPDRAWAGSDSELLCGGAPGEGLGMGRGGTGEGGVTSLGALASQEKVVVPSGPQLCSGMV
jgi:hypothetical protein